MNLRVFSVSRDHNRNAFSHLKVRLLGWEGSLAANGDQNIRWSNSSPLRHTAWLNILENPAVTIGCIRDSAKAG